MRHLLSPKSLEWEAPEHEHFEKTPGWFGKITIVALLLALLAIIFQGILVALLVLIAAFTLMLYGAKIPDLVAFALTPKGIRVGDRLFPYDHLHSFWVSDENERRKLIVQVERFFLPHLVIPLPDDVADDAVRDYLLQYLPEERHEDSLVDMIFDSLGF